MDILFNCLVKLLKIERYKRTRIQSLVPGFRLISKDGKPVVVRKLPDGRVEVHLPHSGVIVKTDGERTSIMVSCSTSVMYKI